MTSWRSTGRHAKIDVIYRVTIEVPTRLSSRQRELLEEYQRASGDEAGPLLSSFLDRMKKLFAS